MSLNPTSARPESTPLPPDEEELDAFFDKRPPKSAEGGAMSSMDSLASSNVSARELRRQRNKTSEPNDGTPNEASVTAAPPPPPIPASEPPSSSANTDQRKRRSRRPRDSSSNSNNNSTATNVEPTNPPAKEGSKVSKPITEDEESAPEESKENTLGRRRRKKSSRGVERSSESVEAQGYDFTSPTGDEKVTIDSADIIKESVAIDIPEAQPTTPVSPRTHDLLFVEEHRRFRRTTRGHVDASKFKESGQSSSGPLQSTEAQVGSLLRRVNLYNLAISYFAYGIIAGFGLLTLILLPWTVSPPSVSTTGGFLGYAASPMILFLEFYPNHAQSISNVFSLLSVFVLLYAIEMKTAETMARRKVNIANHKLNPVPPTQDILTRQEQQRKIGRAWISSSLVFFSWITFLTSIGLFTLDDQLWNGAVTTTKLPRGTSTGGIRFLQSPFLVSLPATADLSLFSGESSAVPWFWFYLKNPVDASSVFPTLFTEELTAWTIMNAVRGLSALLSWMLALLEIRFRGTKKIPAHMDSLKVDCKSE